MKAVDLFAGCGGMSLGFQNAGFNIVAAFEFWDIAAECYEKNFSHPVFRTDLSDVDLAVKQISVFSPDLIIGGPPCQDFSHAGKRIESSRASLTESYAKIVSNIHPKYFVMENVDRAEKSHAFEKAKTVFKNAGYGLTQMVLDASKCGVPQKRKRFFLIGESAGRDCFLENALLNDQKSDRMTIREYLGDEFGTEFYYRHPRSYARRGIFSIDEPSPTIRGVNRPIPGTYKIHAGDATEDLSKVRPLTTLERARIQTFPRDFFFEGGKNDLEQMIGNAVPVELAAYVGRHLLDYMNEKINTPEIALEQLAFNFH